MPIEEEEYEPIDTGGGGGGSNPQPTSVTESDDFLPYYNKVEVDILTDALRIDKPSRSEVDEIIVENTKGKVTQKEFDKAIKELNEGKLNKPNGDTDIIGKVLKYDSSTGTTKEANLDKSEVSSFGLVKKAIKVDKIQSPDATDLESLIILVNEIKSKFNAKIDADTSAGQQES